jgi:muramoyltetrapeptide carboxypeptidase
MIKPPGLKKGDSVYLLNISRKGSADMSLIHNVFDDWGLKPVVGATVLTDGFCQFAAPAEQRLQDLQKALNDENIKAIFFCRGGYGAVQILDRIDFSMFASHPKWIVGYSDITYLHTHIQNHYSIQTVHGPMAFEFPSSSAADLESIRQVLFDEVQTVTFDAMTNHKLNTVEGELTGGNLSILQTTMGTPSEIDTRSRILIIEDVFEDLTSIERMLYCLKRAGKFREVKALLLGDFIIPVDHERSNSIVSAYPQPKPDELQDALRTMVLDLLSEYSFPICFGLPVGHTSGRNAALNFGRNLSLVMSSSQVEITYT